MPAHRPTHIRIHASESDKSQQHTACAGRPFSCRPAERRGSFDFEKIRAGFRRGEEGLGGKRISDSQCGGKVQLQLPKRYDRYVRQAAFAGIVTRKP